MYLYRAVDSQGNTLEFLLSPRRDTEAAKRFFSKALAAPHISTPRIITVDKNAAYPKAFKELKADQIFATQPVGDPEGKRGKLVHLDITRPQAQQYVQCLPSLLGSIGLHAYKRAAGFELSRIMVGGIFGQTHSYEAADNIPHQRSNSRAHQRCEQNAACDDGADTRDQERGSRAQKSANEAAGRGVARSGAKWAEEAAVRPRVAGAGTLLLHHEEERVPVTVVVGGPYPLTVA